MPIDFRQAPSFDEVDAIFVKAEVIDQAKCEPCIVRVNAILVIHASLIYTWKSRMVWTYLGKANMHDHSPLQPGKTRTYIVLVL